MLTALIINTYIVNSILIMVPLPPFALNILVIKVVIVHAPLIQLNDLFFFQDHDEPKL